MRRDGITFFVTESRFRNDDVFSTFSFIENLIKAPQNNQYDVMCRKAIKKKDFRLFLS